MSERAPTEATRTCIVCLGPRRASAVGLCVPCARSYEETDGGDMLDVVRWAVERARSFDEKRSATRAKPRSTAPRCVRCGQKGAGTRTGPDGKEVVLCRVHARIKPCSMCGSLEHGAAHGHPEFWASKQSPGGHDEK